MYNKIPMNSCAQIALDIKTYYAGKNQVTHPNVISFPKPWNGYKYYMAYTPYPYADGSEENPCLGCSNDLINWVNPKGLNNPIAWAEETACDELKDSHLLFREDLGRLEIWYLGRIESSIQEGGPLYCFRKYSYDVTHWSNYEIMYKFEDLSLASPSIIWQDNKYQFWGILNNVNSIGLFSMISEDGFTWDNLIECDVPEIKATNMWHGTVIPKQNGFEMVWVGRTREEANKIYHSVSRDGFTFSTPEVIIVNDSGWKHLYRPSIIYDGGSCYCFYGVVRCDGKWLIGMSHGPNVKELKGITIDDIPYQNDLISSTPKIRFKSFIKSIGTMLIPSLIIVEIAVLFTLLILNFNILSVWIVGILISIVLNRFRYRGNHYLLNGFITSTLSSSLALFMLNIIKEVFTIVSNIL